MSDQMDDAEFMAEMREDFLDSVPSELEACESCLLRFEKSADSNELTEFKRFVHSIKGGARCVGLNDFSNHLHSLESKLQKATQDSRLREFVLFALPFIDQLRSHVETIVAGSGTEESTRKLEQALAKFN